MNYQMLMGYALSVGSDMKYPAFSSEAWSKAAEVSILGMVMIFSVLSILWAVLAIFKLMFVGKVKKTEAVPKTEPQTTSAPVAEEAADDGELIAVITAAIEAYRATDEGMDSASAGSFRVVSFRRAGAGRPWNSNK